MAFALAICSLLPAYAITLLPWSSFPVAVPVVAAMLVAYECLAQLCSHVPSVLLGMVLYLIAFLITFLFSGLFVKQSAVHYPLRPLLLASPMRLGYAAFSKVVFEASQPYGGALECEDCPIYMRVLGRCGNKLPPEEQLAEEKCLGSVSDVSRQHAAARGAAAVRRADRRVPSRLLLPRLDDP